MRAQRRLAALVRIEVRRQAKHALRELTSREVLLARARLKAPRGPYKKSPPLPLELRSPDIEAAALRWFLGE